MRFFKIICLFFICINLLFANSLNNTSPEFDIKNANKQFDHINLQLSVQNLNLANLDAAVNTLTNLTAKAEQCVDDVQKKITNVDILIKQGNSSIEGKTEGADLVYLNNQQKELAVEQSQCRLFSIRAKEAIEAYKTAIAQLKQQETLTRGLPLWKTVTQTIDSPAEANLVNLLTTKIPAIFPSLIMSIAIASIALIGSAFILLRMKESRFARHYLRFKKIRVSYILLLTTFFVSGAFFADLLITSPDITPPELPLVLSGLVFFYLSTILLILFLFKLKEIRAFFYWYSLDNSFFQALSITLVSFYTAAMVGQLFSNSSNPNSPLWQLCQSLFILTILATDACFIYYFCKNHRHIGFIKHNQKLAQRLGFLFLATCAIINILGYQSLAKHLTLSAFITFVILFITLLITQGIKKMYLALHQQQKTKAKIIKYFGYREEQVFTEFLILRSVTQLIVIMISAYLIGQSWGFKTDFIESVYDQFLYGVHLVNITIYPTRIISGVVVFCILYLICRAISTSITNQQQFEDEEETQVAVASILTYIGFTIAVIAGSLVAGFDFTGLAIIAGALSVGIGLGLQSIVNNFVSGLILLIEKPIRPGDRINVDGVEGFVKKIRVRSTQILSPSREDIIIPNSDLITHRVTNYMFSDKFCNIHCEVGVAYGTDTHLVRDVLLAIANGHEEVVKSGRNKPVVLFRSFADSSLIFELGCLIKDVNKKSVVKSDLNFAIEKAFREHNIEMPYPQREIRIKVDELQTVTEKKE